MPDAHHDRAPVAIAWDLMGRGYSLAQAAEKIGADPARLDRAIWMWRALKTNSVRRVAA